MLSYLGLIVLGSNAMLTMSSALPVKFGRRLGQMLERLALMILLGITSGISAV
jgi:hypothetical protein